MFLQCTSGAALPWHRVPLQMVPGGGRRGHGDLRLGAAVVFHAWVTAWATCPPLPAFSRLCVRACTGHSCAQPPRVQPCPLSQVPLTRGRIWAEVPQSPRAGPSSWPSSGLGACSDVRTGMGLGGTCSDISVGTGQQITPPFLSRWLPSSAECNSLISATLGCSQGPQLQHTPVAAGLVLFLLSFEAGQVHSEGCSPWPGGLTRSWAVQEPGLVVFRPQPGASPDGKC